MVLPGLTRGASGRRPSHCPTTWLKPSQVAVTMNTNAKAAGGSRQADDERVRLDHVKPHGALYNLSARDPEIALAIAKAIHEIDPGLVLVGLSGSQSIHAAESIGLRVAHEVFAERGYAADGQLLPRSARGAVIESLDASIAQALDLALHGRVLAADGTSLALRADTLCLHGDRSDAATFARALREALEADGVDILPFGVDA